MVVDGALPGAVELEAHNNLGRQAQTIRRIRAILFEVGRQLLCQVEQSAAASPAPQFPGRSPGGLLRQFGTWHRRSVPTATNSTEGMA